MQVEELLKRPAPVREFKILKPECKALRVEQDMPHKFTEKSSSMLLPNVKGGLNARDEVI